MPKQLTWEDAEDIGIQLSEAHPELDPLTVRFTDMHKHVIELPDFKDDPKNSNEGKLEAIQMAWHTEFLDRTQG
jgi:FeS assembly protein IscX